MNCAAVILAAGASSRMGQPKALLDYRGERFLERLIRLFAACCSEVVVVLGYHADAIEPLVRQTPARAVRNPQPERGQLSSLQCGLAALDPGVEAAFFLPVDYPAISEPTLGALIEAGEQDRGALVVIPRHRERRGHPVLCRRPVIDELLALPPSAQARDVIRRHAGATHSVDVPDAGILADIDDPEAYQKLLAGVLA